jgi:hypothetical protein
MDTKHIEEKVAERVAASEIHVPADAWALVVDNYYDDVDLAKRAIAGVTRVPTDVMELSGGVVLRRRDGSPFTSGERSSVLRFAEIEATPTRPDVVKVKDPPPKVRFYLG